MNSALVTTYLYIFCSTSSASIRLFASPIRCSHNFNALSAEHLTKSPLYMLTKISFVWYRWPGINAFEPTGTKTSLRNDFWNSRKLSPACSCSVRYSNHRLRSLSTFASFCILERVLVVVFEREGERERNEKLIIIIVMAIFAMW